jgi:putative nucleotidyltransferase with HDIG domain
LSALWPVRTTSHISAVRSPALAQLPLSLRWLLLAVVVAAVAASVGVVATTELAPPIGGQFGLAFWLLVTVLSGAAPVRMPGGAVVNVTIAPLVAASALGGPFAAVVVGLAGVTEWRELKGLFRRGEGSTPWYGSLYNHAAVVLPLVVCSVVYSSVIVPGVEASASHLLALVVSGLSYFAMNSALTAAAIALRDGRPFRAIYIGNIKQFGVSMAGLTPVAWLMAAMYTFAGPIGVLPFALPLYTTRAGYKKIVEIRDMFTQTVRSLASAVDAKDPYTAGHSVRVQVIAKELGEELGCSEDDLEALEWGGLLHDIGKIGVPDAVLLKQGALTREERIMMNAHPVKGEEIIRPVQKLAPELPVIRHHHEWYNGSGYPDGLVGEEIPWLARILHVADSFEAMTAARPYRMNPLSEEIALSELRKYSGIQFDPEVVAAFERLIARKPDWASKGAPRAVPELSLPVLGQRDTGVQPA